MVEALVVQGHPLKEIQGYTLRQMDSFLTLAAERQKKEAISMASVVRLAYHAEDKTFQKFQSS